MSLKKLISILISFSLLISVGMTSVIKGDEDSGGGGSQTALQLYSSSDLGMLTHLTWTATSMMSEAVHLIGRMVPLRGVASVAADLGVPGAKTILGILDNTNNNNFSDRIDDDVNEGHEFKKTKKSESGLVMVPTYREEVKSLVGAIHGEQRCLEKLACLTGKRLYGVNGAASITVLMAVAAADYLPDKVKEGYEAFKDAQLYSGSCDDYLCDHLNDNHNH